VAAEKAKTPVTKTTAPLLEGDGSKRTRHSPAEAPNTDGDVIMN